tara:strand:- start:4667 stop:5551 length:885 start_codon:yes stop_codon:yes gene_type:complete
MLINTLINKHKLEFDKYFLSLLTRKLNSSILSKAMIYGSMNGGKRIRPFLVSQAAKIAKAKKSEYMQLSVAIECIHSYSLIHDDLPSMDNDDYRRGKLSTHKKFNEANAILAGDALHDFAFEILSDPSTSLSPNIRIRLVNNLAKLIGNEGLASGQSLDLLYENKKSSLKKIIEMYKLKTGALFEFSFSSPFILTNSSEKVILFYKNYGSLFGLIFQIVDDIIDDSKSFKKIGKTPGKDKKQGKSTLLSLIGKKRVKDFCLNEINDFIYKNNNYFKKNKILEELLKFNLIRIGL